LCPFLAVLGTVAVADRGWGDHLGWGAFAAAVVLLATFLMTEARVPQPITPLRLFADQGRSTSYAARLLVVAGMFGMFYFVTLLLQDVVGFSPLRTGVAFLPMTVTLFGLSLMTRRLLPVVGTKRLLMIGMVPMIVGMAWLSRVSPATTY
jgi:predicted MFS family arabinose efflux permease